MDKQVEVFMVALAELIAAEGTWQEKKRAINAYLEGDEGASTNFEEFLAWFDESEGE